jgi:hypothetical protein
MTIQNSPRKEVFKALIKAINKEVEENLAQVGAKPLNQNPIHSAIPDAELQSYLAQALPTRSRPQNGALDGPASLQEFKRLMTLLLGNIKVEQLEQLQEIDTTNLYTQSSEQLKSWITKCRQLLNEEPAPMMSVNSISGWLSDVIRASLFATVTESVSQTQLEDKLPNDIGVVCLTHFFRWLMEQYDPAIATYIFVDAFNFWEASKRQFALRSLTLWGCSVPLAFRNALSTVPEDYYSDVAKNFVESALRKDHRFHALYAFVLADDRPEQKYFQSEQILENVLDENIFASGKEPYWMALVLDSPIHDASMWLF